MNDARDHLKRAFDLYSEGNFDAAAELCAKAAAQSPGDPNALHLLGLIAGKRGDHADAVGLINSAVTRAPRVAAFRASLGLALEASGQPWLGAAALLQAARLAPGDIGMQERLFRVLRDGIAAGAIDAEQDDFAAAPPPAYPVSVVICSIDPARFAAAAATYRAALAGCDLDIVGIHDARSLAEGYNRGFARARGAVVIFSHDDVDILGAGLGARVDAALRSADVIGIAGTSRLSGPAYAWSGDASVLGWVIQRPDPRGPHEALVFDLQGGTAMPAMALDGVFLCARREVIERVGFDAATFDGFHLYDIDFTYRAFRAGYRVAVSHDIALVHHSGGNFDAAWQIYAERFSARFPEVRGSAARRGLCRVELPTRAAAQAFHTALRRLCRDVARV